MGRGVPGARTYRMGLGFRRQAFHWAARPKDLVSPVPFVRGPETENWNSRTDRFGIQDRCKQAF